MIYSATIFSIANLPLTVQFYDLSTNATSWAWDFGDGGTSTEQDPILIYTTGGTFTVKLTASNSGSSDVLTSTDLIAVLPNAVKNIDYSKYTITTYNHIISIDGVQSKVELFDVAGRSIQSSKVTGKFSSRPVNSGLYIIHVDGYSAKVSVK